MVPRFSGQYKYIVKTRRKFLSTQWWVESGPTSLFILPMPCALCCELVVKRLRTFEYLPTILVSFEPKRLHFNSITLQEESPSFLNPPHNGKVKNFETVSEKLDVQFSFIKYLILIFEHVRITIILLLLCIQYLIFNSFENWFGRKTNKPRCWESSYLCQCLQITAKLYKSWSICFCAISTITLVAWLVLARP